MKEVRIPKGNGGYRTVVVPTEEERARLRALLPTLESAERRLARLRGVEHVAHGFIHGRSPVTNAWAHVGPWRATITMDLASWFDSVTTEQVYRALRDVDIPDADARAIAATVTYGGRTAQGLPTSPAAANLVAVAFDRELVCTFEGTFGPDAYRYTRYADDITISLAVDDREAVDRAIAAVHAWAAAFGWTVSARKTHAYLARAGRRIVTGVAVDDRGVYPTRDLRRRLRAAQHNAPHSPQTRGLAEWAVLRLPRAVRSPRVIRVGETPPLLLGDTPTPPMRPMPQCPTHSPPPVPGGRRIRW